MTGGHGHRGGPMAEINVTPLVDVMLVLLVIFMVTAPLMQQSVDVVLPKASTAQQGGPQEGLSITLTKDHLVYLDKELVTMKELRRKLESLGGGAPIMIRADRHAYVEKLMELWDLCRDTGFRQVHIATTPQ